MLLFQALVALLSNVPALTEVHPFDPWDKSGAVLASHEL